MVKVKDAHKKFVEHLRSQGRSSATVLAYGKDIEQLADFLEQLKKGQVHRCIPQLGPGEALPAQLAAVFVSLVSGSLC